ncbi:MAG: Zn-dependent hydrolase [Bacteroidales bacterium]|nr:Zn-dependent hydrolase [Bacteroidales bacterium]
MKKIHLLLILMVLFFTMAFVADDPVKADPEKYMTFTLTTNIDHLSDNEKSMLVHFFKAAAIMDDLFWQQAYGDKEDLFSTLKDKEEIVFAEINYGPWDRLSGNRPWKKGYGKKPAGANFYPADMTVKEFENLNDDTKKSLYTLIRRDKKNNLIVVPYHVAYKVQLEAAANHLRKAAKLAENEALANYLNLRARALVTDEYQPSDFAWMDMKDANIDFVIGAIENYEDALFGYKAAYEAFILIKDIEWSEKLNRFAEFLPELQTQLPVIEEYKSEVPGSDADINVYDAVYYAGDCNAGSKTIAINLPNDEEVQLKKGSRKLQLKNAMHAKFTHILEPIAEIVIHPEQRDHVTFDAFFSNTMFHEIAHGMGIKNTITDEPTSVRKALKEAYSPIEEGKADILGLWLVTQLHDRGELEGDLMDYYVTFMAGIFRSSRFGASSSHGKANMMRFQYFMENEAFTRDDEGFYLINLEIMKELTASLANKILVIQGNGDYEAAAKWVKTKGVVPEILQHDLNRINEAQIPVDIVFSQGPKKLGL